MADNEQPVRSTIELLGNVPESLLKKLKHFKATLTVTESHTGQKKPKQILKKNLKFKK